MNCYMLVEMLNVSWSGICLVKWYKVDQVVYVLWSDILLVKQYMLVEVVYLILPSKAQVWQCIHSHSSAGWLIHARPMNKWNQCDTYHSLKRCYEGETNKDFNVLLFHLINHSSYYNKFRYVSMAAQWK